MPPDFNSTIQSQNYQTYDQNTDQQRIKRLKLAVIAAGVILIIFLLIISLVNHLTSGGILVTTNSGQNSISIVKSVIAEKSDDSDDSTTPAPKTLVSGQQTKLASGSYIVSVSQGSAEISQVVSIKAGHVSKYTINLPANTPAPELVADINAQSFVVGSSNIYYIDQSTKNLYNIAGQNVLTQLNSTVSFQTVQWADSTFGVGQDSSGNLYTITNGTVAPLAVPQHNSGTNVVYTVAPDHTVYLAIGENVYKQVGANNYQKIYTSNGAPFQIAVVGNLLAINYNPGDNSPDHNKAAITIIDGSNEQASIKIDANSINWSPSGKYLLVGEDETTQIFNTSLDTVAVIPNLNLDGISWLNDNSLIFSSNNQLWQYSLTDQKSQTLAAAPTGHLIGSTDLSADKSYVYMTVESSAASNNDLIIERYGLNGQTSPSFIGTLQSSLPWLQGRCLLSLVNFASPATIESYGGQPDDNCTQVAQSYVQQLGVDPSQFNYQITNVPPDEPSAQ